MSKLRVLKEGLDFAKFTDRSIGNHVLKLIDRLEEDLIEREYEPSSEAEEAMLLLDAEIKDAIEKLEEEEEKKELLEDEELEKKEKDEDDEISDELVSELDPEEAEEDESSSFDDEDEGIEPAE